MSRHRGTLIGTALIAIAGIVLAGCAQAKPSTTTAVSTATTTATTTKLVPVITLVGQTITPDTHVMSKWLRGYLDDVEKRSVRRVKFDLHYLAGLAPAKKELEPLKAGAFDFAQTLPSWYSGVMPQSETTMVPMAWKSASEQLKAIRDNAWWNDMLNKTYAKQNVRAVVEYLSVPAYFMFRNKAVKTVEDFRGLKVMVASNAIAEVMKAFGGSAVTLVPAEYYTSLQTGVVDGMTLGWNTLDMYKLSDLITYIIDAPVGTPGPGAPLLFNLNSWNKLPKDIQKLMEDVGREWEPKGEAMTRVADDAAKKNIEQKVKDGKITIYTPPASELTRWRKVARDVAWTSVAKNMPKEEGDRWLAFMNQYFGLGN